MAKTTRSTVVIPAFNNAALTKQCLDAVLRLGGCKVIVVDDASSDDTLKMLAGFGDRIQVIAHRTNQGFAKTCNDGAQAARTEFVVFLNNDTIPQPGWLRALENYAKKNPRAAVVGSKLVYPNNTIQHAGVVICQDKYPRHIYTGFPADHPAVNQSRRFQLVTAAAMLVRRKVFLVARGFDAKFQNGFEDVDFCLRLGERGHEVHYCAKSLVHHFESVSPGRFKRDRDNVALYRKRWLGKVQPDDVKYFLADGLLELTYEGSFPLHLNVAPELAALPGGRRDDAEKNIAERGRQVAELTREVTRLRVELGAKNPASEALQYDRLRERIRDEVRRHTPVDATVLVASKGDSALLRFHERAGWHFPRTESGVYAGHHPADSAAAIAQLETLRARGAEYFLIPAPTLWWLEHYGQLRAHLENNYRTVLHLPEVCVLFDIRKKPTPAPTGGRKTVLFYRDFFTLFGAHLSVWRYFNHVRQSAGHQARIVFSKRSIWDESNPWRDARDLVLPSLNAIRPDILFLDGADWEALPPEERASSPVPIINRIGGAHHGLPSDVRYTYLGHRAIRICNSQEVADVLADSGKVNGPVFVIPNALDVTSLPQPLPAESKDIDLLICGYKVPGLAQRLAARLKRSGRKVQLLTAPLPRPDYLALVNRAHVALLLPFRVEGFYAPPLEAMALGAVPVAPRTLGTMSYRDGGNCFQPAYEAAAIAAATEEALALSGAERKNMLVQGLQMVAAHSVDAERQAFLGILNRAEELWSQK